MSEQGPASSNKKVSAILRFFGGGYLTYLGWDLIRGLSTNENREIFIAFGIGFIIIGVLLIALAMVGYYKLIKKDK